MFERILEGIESNGFRDVAGARASTTIPVSERLLNEIVSTALPPGALREIHVQPQEGNRFAVRVRLARPAFLPAITIALAIERQPDFPHSPVLELRIATLPGLAAFAGAAFSFAEHLPPGMRLEADRIRIDLAAMADRQGHGRYVKFVKRMSVATEAGRLIVSVDLEVQ